MPETSGKLSSTKAKHSIRQSLRKSNGADRTVYRRNRNSLILFLLQIQPTFMQIEAIVVVVVADDDKWTNRMKRKEQTLGKRLDLIKQIKSALLGEQSCRLNKARWPFVRFFFSSPFLLFFSARHWARGYVSVEPSASHYNQHQFDCVQHVLRCCYCLSTQFACEINLSS